MLDRQKIGAFILRGSELREKTHKKFLSTGVKHLDLFLSGGIPRGQITEIIGSSSSGKTSFLFSILAQATTQGEWVAYIDPFASLDPAFAQKAGIDLQRLLWVRGGTSFLPDKILKAADILAGAGGFGVVVLDLETGREMDPEVFKKIPFHIWFRLKRAVQGTSTILLILAKEAKAGSAVSRAISLRRRKTQWCFTTDEKSSFRQAYFRPDYPRHACLLRGICNEMELLRGENPYSHATFYCYF